MPDLNQDEQRRYSWYARFMQQAGAAPKSFDEWRNLFNQQRIDVSPQGTDRIDGRIEAGELAKNATSEATYEIQRQATNPWDGFWESFFNAARGGSPEVQNDPLPEVPDEQASAPAEVQAEPEPEVQPEPRPKVQNDPLVTTLSEIMDQYVQKQRTIQEWTQDLDRALRRQSLARGFDPTADRHHLVKQLGDALDHEMLVAQLTDMLDMRSSSYSADDEIDLGAEPDRYPERDEYATSEPPIVRFRKMASKIESSLPPVAEGMTRLWRGNRPDEVGHNPQFTNSLEGIALPFRQAYNGPLSYVDVSSSDLPSYEQNVGAAPGAEFVVPGHIASQAKVVSHEDYALDQDLDQYAALSWNPIMHPRGGPGNPGQFTRKIGVDPDAMSSPEPGGPGMESDEPQAMVAPPLPPARAAVARVDLPDEINNKVQELAAHIPDYLLDGEGRTKDAHITIKMLADDDPSQIAPLLQDEAPFRAVLGQVTVVDATEARPFDVVAIKVHSPALNRLHAKLSRALEGMRATNNYAPHLRVADVQPGTADRWIGWDGLEGESVIVDSLTFVNRNHEAHKIPLQGQKGEYQLDRPEQYAAKQLSMFDAPVQSQPRAAAPLPQKTSTPLLDRPVSGASRPEDQPLYEPPVQKPLSQAKSGASPLGTISVPRAKDREKTLPPEAPKPQSLFSDEEMHEARRISPRSQIMPSPKEKPSGPDDGPDFGSVSDTDESAGQSGGLGSGVPDGGSDIGRPWIAPSVRTARPEYTHPADTSIVPEVLQRHLTYEDAGTIDPATGSPVKLDYQLQRTAKAFTAMRTHGGFVDASGPGTGKAAPLDSLLLTPDGWKRMGDVKVGDAIISVDGTPTEVTGVYPRGIRDIYRITMSDGATAETCDEHLWFTETVGNRKVGKEGSVKPLLEIMKSVRTKQDQRLNHKIPIVSPVQFTDKPVPIDPYLMGLLLGDGCLVSHSSVSITTADKEIADAAAISCPPGMQLKRASSEASLAYYFTKIIKNSHTPNPLVSSLRAFGLIGKRSRDKFIPDDYLFNSPTKRLAVLQGLMDTDGTISANGYCVSYCSVSKSLVDGVIFLVRSLGGIATHTTKIPKYQHNGQRLYGQLCYIVNIAMPPSIVPFRLQRKVARVVPKSKYPPTRYITNVEFVAKKQCQCITIDHPSRLYVMDDFIVTHNSRVQLAAAKMWADQGMKAIIVTRKQVIGANWDMFTYGGSFHKDGSIMDADAPGTLPKLLDGQRVVPEIGNSYITTYDKLPSLLQHVDNDTVILFDESHSGKNETAMRSNVMDEAAHKAHSVMYSTATPADKPLHIAHMFRAKVFGNRPPEETYKELGLKESRHTDKETGAQWSEWKIDPKIGGIEVHRRLNGLFNRMTKEGLMVKHEIDLTGTEAHFKTVELPDYAYDELANLEDNLSHGLGIKNMTGGAKGRALLAMRRHQETYKIPAIIEHVQNELADDPNRQIVIFADRINESKVTGESGEMVHYSQGTIKMLADALARAGISGIAHLHGGSTVPHRDTIRGFQEGKHQVMLATLGTGGTGVDLPDLRGDRPRTVIMMTGPLAADQNVQAVSRTIRLSSKSNSRLAWFFSNAPIDDWGRKLLAGKMATLGAVVKGEVEKLQLPFDIGSEGMEDLIASNRDQIARSQLDEPYEWRQLTGLPQIQREEDQQKPLFEGMDLGRRKRGGSEAHRPPPKGYKRRSYTQDGTPERYTMTAGEIAEAVKGWKEPSKAQIEAENYTKPTIAWKGLTIKIETPKGKKRNPAWPEMPAHYGYFSRVGDQASEDARDGDKPDVFIGPNPASDLVVVIDQETPSGRFDEWKVIIGCNSKKEAVDLYRSAYTSGWRVGPATAMTSEQFRAWLSEMPDKGRIAEQVSKYAAKYDFSDIHPRHEQNKRFIEKHASLTLAQTIDRPPTPGERKTYDDYVDFLKVGGTKPMPFKDWLKFHRTTKYYQAQKEREDAAKAAAGRRDSEGPGEDPEVEGMPDQDLETRERAGPRDSGAVGQGGEAEQLIGGKADKGLERAATSVSNINAVREFAANLYAAYYES